MKLDQNTHKKMMLQILSDISSDSLLANNLGFKGGTACYFIHGLDRFSVDLDFDIIDQTREDLIRDNLIQLLKQYGTIKTRTSIKLKYSDEYQALKVDLSSRYDINQLNTYQVTEIVSRMPIKVLQQEDIFAHKLIALTDRNCAKGDTPLLANRDIYDIYFFFQQNWQFNQDIIRAYSHQSVAQYLQRVYDMIDKYTNESNILDRLGELVNTQKRNWIKNNLKKEVLTQLAIQIKLQSS